MSPKQPQTNITPVTSGEVAIQSPPKAVAHSDPEEFAGFEAVCQRSTEKIGDHRDEAISTLCQPEPGGTELTDLEESRSKETGHVIGQGENGLGGKNQ